MDDFAQFALPEEERKRLLLSNLMMGLGAGLLDSRGKNVWPAISTGLLGGMQMGQQAIGQAQRGMVDSYKLKREFEQDKEKNALAAAAAGKQAEYESALSGIFSGAPDLSRMGTGGPTPENAARVAPPDRIAQYRKAADFYMARNDVAKAKEAAAIADKLEEEYSTTPQTVRGADGKLQLVQFGKRGNAKVAEGMTPAEKLHFASTGSMAGVGLDPYSGAQVSAGLPMTMTPGEEDASKRGWANYRLSADAAKRTTDAAANPKPQLVDGQWVYAPDAQNPAGRALPVSGMKQKEDKPTDQQLSAAAFGSRMADATKILDGLEKKNPYVGMVANSVQSAKNVPLIGAGTGAAANIVASFAAPGAQSYVQAKRAWIRAKLRKESGAVIGVEEEAMEDATFFPQTGDSKAQIAQKAQMRRDVERSLAIQSRGQNKHDDPLELR